MIAFNQVPEWGGKAQTKTGRLPVLLLILTIAVQY